MKGIPNAYPQNSFFYGALHHQFIDMNGALLANPMHAIKCLLLFLCIVRILNYSSYEEDTSLDCRVPPRLE